VKLEGSLDAFSLPDIFQLLSFTKKSGGLHLRRADTRGCVYFLDGAVSQATSDEGRQALARRLIALTIVGDDDLAAAVKRSEAEPNIGVAKALLEAGAIDAQTLRDVANEHAVDAVFDFLRWADGDFSFSVGEVGPDDVGISVPVEELVTASKSRLESWEQARKAVPSSDAVLVVPLTIDDDAILSQAEWALLALVDGRRTVTDLVEMGGRGEFAVVSALAAMVERDLLAVGEGDEQGASALTRRYAVLSKLETATPRVNSFERAADIEPVPPVVAADEPGEIDDSDDSDDSDDADDDSDDEPTREGDSPDAPRTPVSPFARTRAPSLTSHPDKADGPDAAAADGHDDDHVLVPDTRAQVMPGRAEGFGPRRRPDFPDDAGYLAPRTSLSAALGVSSGGQAAAAPALAEVDPNTHIERDPSVNKSLLLRLIAGVRGL
jgi:hypothetical protein